MSSSTVLTYSRFYCGGHFTDLYQVEDAIREYEHDAQQCQQKILAYALMTQPKEMLNLEPDVSPIDIIPNVIETLFDEYDQANARLSFLYDLKEHWKNCHNGNEPIEIQEDNFDKKAYINLE